MIELILTLCLLASPTQCKVEHVPFLALTGMDQCVHEGQIKAVEYIQAHPGWLLRRYECGLPRA